MSSPFIMSHDFPDRRTMSSPAPTSRENSSSRDSQDISVKPMRLKVLYTFDDQNKTNCLARWPQVLHIRTACLDENTQIGVIELKTCIQAIVAASPELVAKLGQDYTVYAYDYSEYETPLVGQGMLSWVLASSSTTPSAPAYQSKTMVTGRVCRNILGLFSSGAQETLEVKLRLVPVPTCLQSEYLESMRKYRELSKVMPEQFDAQAWANFLQANPGILNAAEQSRSQSPFNGAGQREVGMEHVQRLLSDGCGPQTSREEHYRQRRDSLASTMDEQSFYRTGSPALSINSNIAQPTEHRSNDRANFGASNRGDGGRGMSRMNSIDFGYMSNDDQFEEGPAKKRAKLMKADWPTKGGLGKQVESLRVAASTAASVRVFQPTAMRPSANPANSLEEPPRAPTPIPRSATQSLRPPMPTAKSGLGRLSYSISASEYTSPYASSDIAKPIESAMTSPEDCRATYSPCDPASSPPVVQGISPVRGVSPTPSSPALPALPRHPDSGFMSGSLDDLFGGNDENRPIDETDLAIASQYSKRPEFDLPPPTKKKASRKKEPKPELTQQQKDERAAAYLRRQARNAAMGANALSRTTSTGSINQASIPASDPVRSGSNALQRAQSWSGQHPASDVPVGSEGLEAPRPRSRSGHNNAKRKQAIKTKLATSIAAGEVPPFCDNCGAIETPTWRKAYTKLHCGGTELVQISEAEGGIVACVILETNDDGSTRLFKIIKKSLLKTDTDFTEILLCNPCGLWLHNHKCMRPPTVWDQKKDDKPRNGGRKKSDVTQKPENGRQGGGEPTVHSDGSSPMDGPINESPQEPESNDDPELPPIKRKRALSVQMLPVSAAKSDRNIAPTAVAALQRAIQSSPGQFLGSRHIPIEIDDCSPKPTRRVLFPSPKSSKSVGLQDCNDISPVIHTIKDPFVASGPDPADKENLPPVNDEFDDLFNDIPRSTSCPSSPPSASKALLDPFKTPTKTPQKRILTTGDFFSSAAKAFFHPSRTPSRTPLRSPSSHKHGLAAGTEMTPFTRHLNDLLSDTLGVEGSPSHFSPGKFLDFPPSLPPLEGEGGNETPGRYFQSEDFDFGQLTSEAVGLPSSPPAAWFGVYEDPAEGGVGGWNLGLGSIGSSPFKEAELGQGPTDEEAKGGGDGADGDEARAAIVKEEAD